MNEQQLAKYQQELDIASRNLSVQQQQQSPYAPAMFPNTQKQNLIELELDFKTELEAIERLLRCDVLIKDNDGNEVWGPNPDSSKVFFNEVGVSDFLRNLVVLVNKNKVLANYSIEEINDRVLQIKHEIRILIYNNYEMYGMDNPYKMNNYSMIVISIGSIIEDAYRRALNGETHKGLAEQRLVTQNESINQSQFPQLPSQKKSGLARILPWNWKN
jgi:hypothetical protein